MANKLTYKTTYKGSKLFKIITPIALVSGAFCIAWCLIWFLVSGYTDMSKWFGGRLMWYVGSSVFPPIMWGLFFGALEGFAGLIGWRNRDKPHRVLPCLYLAIIALAGWAMLLISPLMANMPFEPVTAVLGFLVTALLVAATLWQRKFAPKNAERLKTDKLWYDDD
jgi:hypothetical protein